MSPATWIARRPVVILIAAATATLLAGCALVPSDAITGERGGTLTVLDPGPLDAIDPGQAYSQAAYLVTAPTQRTLYGFDPARPKSGPVGDLAAGVPQISNGAKRVEISLRPGVHFSPPVDRAVRAADVKYAIERGFTRAVATPYATAYLGDIVGVAAFRAGRARDITGIETPNDRTLVFRLTHGTGRLLSNALTLPISAPVPPEYAARFDRGPVSTYATHQVATGPYMLRTRSLTRNGAILVRNPNWRSSTDYRPAFVNRIVLRFNAGDPASTARTILAGRGLVGAGFIPPPDVLTAALRTRPDQVARPTGSVTRWVALNTTVPPFNRPNVRKAVSAALDPTALRAAYGGAAFGELATHYIPPRVPGFEQGGGLAGPNLDFLDHRRSDLPLARRYLIRAGYSGGRYTGPPVSMVGIAVGQARAQALAVRDQLARVGIRTRLELVDFATMYGRCSDPAARVAICPNLAWHADFPDGETVLAPTFDGASIQPRNNANWSQLDNPQVNAQMASASVVTGQKDRADAWGGVDRSVAQRAAAVPWLWDRAINLRSANVKGVVNLVRSGWDLAFCSLR